MPALIAAEFLKLRTIRSPWLMLGAAPLIVVAGISGFVVSNGHTPHEAQQGSALGHVGLTSVITLMFGILAVASEYRHKTITDTYLSTPRRDRVIQSKLVVYTLVGGLSGVLASAVGLATAAAWWAGKGASFSWSDARMWQTIGGSIAWNAGFAAIGVGPRRADPQPRRRHRRRLGLAGPDRRNPQPAGRQQPRPLAAVQRRTRARRVRPSRAGRPAVSLGGRAGPGRVRGRIRRHGRRDHDPA